MQCDQSLAVRIWGETFKFKNDGNVDAPFRVIAELIIEQLNTLPVSFSI